MNQKIANILEQVYKLTADERAELIETLTQDEACEFASPEIARAWEEEIERRIAAYERGEVQAMDAYKVAFRRSPK
jgi:putative addiction module component (TIGR02574 family)